MTSLVLPSWTTFPLSLWQGGYAAPAEEDEAIALADSAIYWRENGRRLRPRIRVFEGPIPADVLSFSEAWRAMAPWERIHNLLGYRKTPTWTVELLRKASRRCNLVFLMRQSMVGVAFHGAVFIRIPAHAQPPKKFVRAHHLRDLHSFHQSMDQYIRKTDEAFWTQYLQTNPIVPSGAPAGWDHSLFDPYLIEASLMDQEFPGHRWLELVTAATFRIAERHRLLSDGLVAFDRFGQVVDEYLREVKPVRGTAWHPLRSIAEYARQKAGWEMSPREVHGRLIQIGLTKKKEEKRFLVKPGKKLTCVQIAKLDEEPGS